MKVLVAYPLLREFAPLLRERLGPGHDLHFVPPAECDCVDARFAGTQVLVTPRFPAAWGPRFPDLRLLHAVGAGVEKIDLAALPPAARVCRTFGHGTSIAEFVLLAMLALLRDLLRADRSLRAGRWRNPQYDPWLPLPRLLQGQTVVLLGTGEIGTAIALQCRRHEMVCIGVNRSGKAPAGGEFDEVLPLAALDRVLPRADFLVVAVPLTDDTCGLIGARELGLLRPAASLVNVARGPVVDEAALYQALRDGRLGGAALDVWHNYPPAGSAEAAPSRFPFHELDRVVMTPHISGTTAATFRHRAEDIAANILAVAAGGALRNEVPRSAPAA